MEFKYPSNRSSVFVKNAVATSQYLASQAGLKILQEGGNALDAALATAICLTVVEPVANGIGGDAFAIIWDGKKLQGYNGSGKSPAAWSYDKYKHLKEMPTEGWGCITIPGQVKAWKDLSAKYGKLPFKKLFNSAIHYAENGFLVSPIVAYQWELSANIFGKHDGFRNTFTINGQAPKEGTLFQNPSIAKSLKAIAASYGDDFYTGAIAEKIIKEANANGANWSEDDLKSHKGEWVELISTKFKDLELNEIPPNGQGLAALIALGIINKLDIEKYAVDTLESIHLQIESMKISFKEVFNYVADRDQLKWDVSELLSEEYFKKRASEISLEKAKEVGEIEPYAPGTVYISTADESGMMVSYIQSNFMGFGSGVVIPETGISMQNRGAGFIIDPNHPNCVAGSKRPFHTIIPGFVTKNGQPLMSFGVMGGHMQAQGHLQMMLRVFCYGQNPQEALDAPRWMIDESSQILLEKGFNKNIAKQLMEKGHKVLVDQPFIKFGGGQIILKNKDGYHCGTDHRKDGAVAGF